MRSLVFTLDEVKTLDDDTLKKNYEHLSIVDVVSHKKEHDFPNSYVYTNHYRKAISWLADPFRCLSFPFQSSSTAIIAIN